MSKLHDKCNKCFELHKMDCSGQDADKPLDCYLHRKKEDKKESN